MKRNTSVQAIAGAAPSKSNAKHLPMRSAIYAAMFALLLAIISPSAQAQTFHALHEFTGGSDGEFPEAVLLRDSAGNLFGTAFSGGANTAGVVFKIDSTNAETVPFAFNITDGAFPNASLTEDSLGTLFGVANDGPSGGGVVFKLAPDGTQTLLHSFKTGSRNLSSPSGGVLLDSAGNIFGTTLLGGSGVNCSFGCGVVYKINTTLALRVLHAFTGGTDGSLPIGPLVQDAAGNLFGVAKQGGNLTCPEALQVGCGTVFKISSAGKLTVLHSFRGGIDGVTPQGGLLIDAAGNLFGATAAGGGFERGTIFTISSAGKYSVLHRFTGVDGATPNGSLAIDSTGNLFGTAQTGGLDGLGIVFELSPAGKLTSLHDFTGDLDGANPMAGVILDPTGNLFGTAIRNFTPQPQDGSVFEITF